MDLNSTQEKALDVELPGPKSSVTDLSVCQGTTVEDSARLRSTKQETIRILVPLDDGSSSCALCTMNGINIICLNLKDLADHLATHHVRATVQWTCVTCEKSFLKVVGDAIM